MASGLTCNSLELIAYAVSFTLVDPITITFENLQESPGLCSNPAIVTDGDEFPMNSRYISRDFSDADLGKSKQGSSASSDFNFGLESASSAKGQLDMSRLLTGVTDGARTRDLRSYKSSDASSACSSTSVIIWICRYFVRH
jgi:hypothetical protein